MTSEQLQAVRRRFIEYANGYIARAGAMRQMMELKRGHCAAVAGNCRELAVSNGWKQNDVNTAVALGFLHDVGRFPQLEEYGTFRDDLSINHGERGEQAICESGLLDEAAPALRDAILCGVRHHNARTMPDDLPEPHYRWLKLVRDADRLDIYRIVLDTLVNDKVEEHPDIVLNLSLEGDPCPEIIETIRQKIPPSYPHLKCVADFLLMLLSWSYQMNYPATLKIMRERNIIDRVAAHLPTELPAVGNVVSNLRKQVEEACSQKTS